MKFEDWKQKKLGEVLNLKRGYDLPVKKRRFGSYPIISSSGENGFHDEFKSKGPGVITGRSGLLGHVYYIEEDFWPLNTSLYVEDFKGNNPLYIYYLLKTMNLENYNAGSSVPTLNRNHVHLLDVKIPVKSIQLKIAKTLYMFEKKIKLNNYTISNLEELAQTLFKRWFVDFEFPNEEGKPYKSNGGKMIESEFGMIPEGWEVESLSKIANFQNGLAMQKFRPGEGEDSLPVLKIKELRQGFTDYNSDLCSTNIKDSVKVYDGDVIFSWSATLLVKLWGGGNAGLNQHLFKVTSQEHSKWFYYLWTKHYLDLFNAIAQDKATTMGHIKRSHLDESKVIVPSEQHYIYFDSVFNRIIEQKINLLKENKSLIGLRDTLLPKLLSGEIELPDDMEVTDDVPIS